MEQMLCSSVESTYPGRNALPICLGPTAGLLRLKGMRPDSSSSKPVAQRGRGGCQESGSPELTLETQPSNSPFGHRALVARAPTPFFVTRIMMMMR